MKIESGWETGQEVAKRLKLKNVEIVKPVQQGLLQPFNAYGEVLLPPGVGKTMEQIRLLSEEIESIEKDFPRIGDNNIDEWRLLNKNRKIDATGNLVPIQLPSGINSEIVEEYELKKAHLEQSQKKVNKYTALPSWKGYELPQRPKDRERDINLLLNAQYKLEDVLELLKDQHNACPISEKDHDHFIRSLQVSYVNDTEIRIKVGSGKSKVYDQSELGFKKEKSKTWVAFTDILRRGDHTYHVGKARGANRERKASYDAAQKTLTQINDKLVSFFNKTYQAQLPEKFKLYELIPEKKEPPGTYRFRFQVFESSDSELFKSQYKVLSQGELLSTIESLSSKLASLSNRGDEASEKAINNLRSKIYSAVGIACEKGWLQQNRASAYLNPQPEKVFPDFPNVYEKEHPDLDD